MVKLQIKIKFFPLSNGKNMMVQLQHKGNVVDILPDQKNIGIGTISVDLPTTVKLIFSNKDMNHDTVVDQNNNVVEDLHIVVKEISIDNFATPVQYIQKKLTLITENQQVINSHYIGFNGEMTIEFEKSSVFQQVMSWSSM